MKKVIFFILFLMTGNFVAQELDLDKSLPISTKVKKGVLKNGLTYYIYKTDVIKNAASYYIIQNVGSVLENEDQQGLAHFLEHMAFNGTENFKGKGVLNTLQKHGAVFGQDINAYTAFDETVYNMNNIPVTSELVDTCLLILRDWANGLLLTEEEIDAERGVIKEEWRTRQSGGMRIFKQSLPVMFNNTIYAERMPIGVMNIIENFEYKSLKDFYHDWYRTDLQAIAIIGDVDVAEIENKINKLFSKIPSVENSKERKNIEIPDNSELLYVLVKDKEVTTSQIEFGIRHPRKEYSSILDLKNFLKESIIVKLLNARIAEVIQSPTSPLLNARIKYGKHSRTTNSFSVSINPKPNQQHQAFKTVIEEINRAEKFGFTQEEIKRAISEFKSYYKNLIIKEDDKSHEGIVYGILQNYLEKVTMVNVTQQYPIVENILNNLSNDELHAKVKSMYTQKNRYLLVTGVEGKKNLLEAEALKIIKDTEGNRTLKAYTDKFSGKTLISRVKINKGNIEKESFNKELNAKTFELSNGVKVHFKFSDKNKEDVKLKAISNGGLSLVKEEDLPSAKYTGTVVQQSGLGDYSVVDLKKILAGKTAATYIDISSLTESIEGVALSKDVETMLQMVYLRYTKPRFDENSYKIFKSQVDNYLVRRSNDVNEKIRDSVLVNLYGKNNPHKPIFNSEYAEQINFEKIKRVYSERFKNVADFEFFVVGDIEESRLKDLLEQYIASIPTEKVEEKWKDNYANWISEFIDKDVFIKMEDPKSTVKIAYKNNYEYSLKSNLLAKVLADLLGFRYMETLRENEGGTYGATTYGNVTKEPQQYANLWVEFDCDPARVEKLLRIVHDEIKKIAKGQVSEIDLNKIKNNYLKENKQQKDSNSYDMKVLTNYYREGINIENPKNFENIVNKITKNDIVKFTKAFLKNNESYEIVVKPLLNE